MQNWCHPFWTAVSVRVGAVSKSCSIHDIAKILAVYAMALPKDGTLIQMDATTAVKSGSSALIESCSMMYGKLLSVVDLRLRQTEGKAHLPLTNPELGSILSIFMSTSLLEGCNLTQGLMQRLIVRITSNPDFWTDDDMVLPLCQEKALNVSRQIGILDALERLGYRDRHANLCGFILNILAEKDMADQHKLCAIVKRLPSIKPKRMSNARLNTTLVNSLMRTQILFSPPVRLFSSVPEELSMAELTDLMDGLARLDANVTKIPLKEITDEFFNRSPECTPQQVQSHVPLHVCSWSV